MPKLSRSILKRIDERPFAEKQKVAREAYHQWRLSEQNSGPRRKKIQGAKVLAQRATSFPSACLLIPRGTNVDPYQIKDGDKTYEFWWIGDHLQIRTYDPAIGRGRKRKPVSYIDRITRESFRTGYFVKRGARRKL